MIRVHAVSEFENFSLMDVNGVKRSLKLYNKNGNLYIGPIQALFNRAYVCKDKNRMDFVSKIDSHFNEIMHISSIFNKIDECKCYSNFTKDMIKKYLYSKGFTDEDFKLKEKTYTCARENFIDFGFNSMNFCLDKKGDIWVHYKKYEEQKQYREIVNQLPENKIDQFDVEYKRLLRFIRYANTDNELRCFSLKSINITKLYQLLSDYHVLHKVKYVSDIYNEVMRELEFTDITTENTYIKIVVNTDGFFVKENVKA